MTDTANTHASTSTTARPRAGDRRQRRATGPARALAVVAAVAAGLGALVAPAGADSHGGTADPRTGAPAGERFLRPLTARLSGMAEVDGTGRFDRGDPDGTGMAVLYVSEDFDVLCYSLEVRGIDPATAAHIHGGTIDVAGPVVQPLTAPTSGSSQGCTAPAATMNLRDLVAQPQDYYVNVHNAAYPPGAVRGQTSIDSWFDYVVDERGSIADVPGSEGARTGPVPGLRSPVVDMASTPDDAGTWVVTAAGDVHARGTARSHGSLAGQRLNAPIVAMAATPTGRGYWLTAADGGTFSFGDARFFGSTGALRLQRPIVDMVASPTGRGYWLVASDGGVFAFGDARFFGSTGAMRLNRPIVAMAGTPHGDGYTLVASDGGVFTFGAARFHGSLGAIRLNQPIIDVTPSATGGGYRMLAGDGGIFAFGDAEFLGSAAGVSTAPLVAID